MDSLINDEENTDKNIDISSNSKAKENFLKVWN